MAKMDWFEIWFEDKTSIIDIMLKNMQSDLNAGYAYYGKSITDQRFMIAEYKARFELDLEKLKEMEPNKVQHWCYIDLKKRGAIA